MICCDSVMTYSEGPTPSSSTETGEGVHLHAVVPLTECPHLPQVTLIDNRYVDCSDFPALYFISLSSLFHTLIHSLQAVWKRISGDGKPSWHDRGLFLRMVRFGSGN